MNDPDIDERIARAMRDSVMEQQMSDENWEACKRSWIKSLELFRKRLRAMGIEVSLSVNCKCNAR